MAVGEGYRTNAEGIRRLRALLGDTVDAVIPMPLPTGLDRMIVSICFRSLALLIMISRYFSRMMPVPFRQLLLARGMCWWKCPDKEYDSMACNVLAVARKCVMLAGNPITQQRLEAAGAEVWTYAGPFLLKGGGGPTCLTHKYCGDFAW